LEIDAQILSDAVIQGLVDDWIVPLIVDGLVERLLDPCRLGPVDKED
jgi:hypothetical protein